MNHPPARADDWLLVSQMKRARGTLVPKLLTSIPPLGSKLVATRERQSRRERVRDLALALIFALALAFAVAVGEAGVAQSRPDGEYAPTLDPLQKGDLGQSLHDAVVVHHDGGVVIADPWDGVDQAFRQVELAALPVAGQVLRAFLDRAVVLDHAGARNADERRKLESPCVGLVDQFLEHLDETLHRLLAARFVVGVAPQVGLPHAGLGKVRRLLAARPDDAAADIGAADVDCENGVVPLEYPRRREVQRADETRFVRMMADRQQLDLEVRGLEDDLGARDGELAEPAVAEAAADHDTLGLLPSLAAEDAPRDVGELLREVLDGAVHHRGGLGVVADQHGVEHLLADVLGRLVAERIPARLEQGLAPLVENVPEGGLAGAVAEKAFLVLELDIEAVDVDRRKAGGPVSGNSG